MRYILIALSLLIATPAIAADKAGPPCPEKFSVYFDTAKWDLRPDALHTLEGVVACIKEIGPKWQGVPYKLPITVVGNADPRKFNTNEKLSQRRAQSVVDFLAKRGVDAGLISIYHEGDTKQVCTEKTPACLQENRRVDVTVIAPPPLPPPPPPVVCEKCPPLPAPVVVERVVERIVEVEKQSPWEVMVYGQFGAHINTDAYPKYDLLSGRTQNGTFHNWGVYNIGTEFHFKPLRLGLRTAVGNTGITGLLQVFPVQGRLNWYVGAGGGYTAYPFHYAVVPEVNRYFDVQVGTGVEYAFTPHWIGLADLKASIPVPWQNAPRLTWTNVGDALTQTSLLVGIGYRF